MKKLLACFAFIALLGAAGLALAANAPISRNYVVSVPSPDAAIGITGVSTTSDLTVKVLKATPGNVYSAYVTNATATAGKLILVNAAADPGAGALTGATVLDCVAVPASGSASIDYHAGPPKVFSIGIVAIFSSNASCFTYTSGVVSGFIAGQVQ